MRYARVGPAINDREHVSYLVEVLEHPHQNGGTYWAIEREVGFRPDGTVAWKWPTATNESDPRIWWAGKKEVDADPIRAAEFEHCGRRRSCRRRPRASCRASGVSLAGDVRPIPAIVAQVTLAHAF